ncbi:MAG: hypothetical protein ABJC60_09270 [Actinomycetota bacterium]
MKTPIAAALTLGLLSAACGNDPEPTPTAAVSTPPTSAAASLQSLAPGTLPTSSPGAASGTVRVGIASIRLEGGLAGDISLLLLATPVVYSPPPGATAVVWTDGLQTLGIAGDSFVGPLDTSATLSLSLQVRDGAEVVALESTAGECSINMDTAIVGSFAGSFTCRGLSGATAAGVALSVNATGTFSASG